MSVPARFLALFAVPAVVPPTAVNIFDCVRSTRAPGNLVADQVESEREKLTPLFLLRA